ncbi:MAG TPA: hypothetical protein DCF62_12780 [Porticoccaceae bacterium]|nr:hypothetical protein [Porticoccaceae bacterium]
MTQPSKCINYGPLRGLIGNWEGDKGVDIAPEPEGAETNPYYESLRFEAVGDVTNAGEQTLAVLSYRQLVRRKVDDEIFHHEIGYWIWDAAAETVMHSLAIPRGVTLLAGGTHKTEADGTIILEVAAAIDNPDWSIVQSPFMNTKARTTAFSHKVTLKADHLTYMETTSLDIYGRSFEHTDSNALTRS